MDIAALIGAVAGFLTTTAFIPQVIKVLKTNNTEAISLKMYLMTVIGIFLWLIHGIFINSQPLIVANSITFILAGIILITKIKNIRKGLDNS